MGGTAVDTHEYSVHMPGAGGVASVARRACGVTEQRLVSGSGPALVAVRGVFDFSNPGPTLTALSFFHCFVSKTKQNKTNKQTIKQTQNKTKQTNKQKTWFKN